MNKIQKTPMNNRQNIYIKIKGLYSFLSLITIKKVMSFINFYVSGLNFFSVDSTVSLHIHKNSSC
jgi:hypothetical protein